MFPYLLILLFVMFWIVLEQKTLNRKSFWMPLIVLVFFASIRDLSVGTDTVVYTGNFVNKLDFSYFEFNEDIESGYQLLEYSLLKFTDNYFWLLLVGSIIVVTSYLFIIKKFSVNYWFSIFLFMTLGIYTFFFNGLRQGIAMALFSLATPYLIERKILPYILICVFAALFHNSALFMIPFYFLVNINIRIIYKVLITFATSLLSSSFLISYLAADNKRYEDYTKVSEEAGGLMTLGFYTVLGVFMYIVSYRFRIREEMFIKLFTFYSVGIAFIIPIALLGTNPSGPQRLITYFTWTLVLLLPVVFRKINNKYIFSFFTLTMIVYFFLTTSRFSNLTPYTVNPIFEVL